MSFISDTEAEALGALLSRRAMLGATAAGGLLATPLSAFAQAAASGPGDAEITVDQARQAPIPIVIPSFGAGLGEQISGVISSDLESTVRARLTRHRMQTGAVLRTSLPMSSMSACWVRKGISIPVSPIFPVRARAAIRSRVSH